MTPTPYLETEGHSSDSQILTCGTVLPRTIMVITIDSKIQNFMMI